MKQTKGRITRDGAAVRRVQVMLDEETVERAKALGDGNLSVGLRKMAKEAEMKVVTYQAPNGETIDLSQSQAAMLERAQKWPRNSRGEEYCSVSHGLHEGEPTYSDAQLRAEVGIADYDNRRAHSKTGASRIRGWEQKMARYILIDNNSGYIFGDSADFASGRQSEIESLSDAARMLDESIGEYGRKYTELARNPNSTVTGYDVYRADINGSEAVPVVMDGQDAETISAVVSCCEYVGFVECEPGE